MSVVQFPGAEPGPSETAFMVCSCSEDAVLLPVVIADPDRPLVVGVQCPECDAYRDVINGIVQ